MQIQTVDKLVRVWVTGKIGIGALLRHFLFALNLDFQSTNFYCRIKHILTMTLLHSLNCELVELLELGQTKGLIRKHDKCLAKNGDFSFPASKLSQGTADDLSERILKARLTLPVARVEVSRKTVVLFLQRTQTFRKFFESDWSAGSCGKNKGCSQVGKLRLSRRKKSTKTLVRHIS